MQISLKPLLISLISLGLIACGGDSKDKADQPAIKEVAIVESSCPNNRNASAGSQWCWADPFPQGNMLNSLAIGNGEYLFAGDGGTLLFTQDFQTWENINLNNSDNSAYHAASYHNGLWMVSSDHGVVISADKTKWEHVRRPEFSSLDHHYANGVWVSVGERRTIATSKDGRQWSIKHIEADERRLNALVSVYYGDGLWIAVGEDGALFTSKDAESWEYRTIDTLPYREFTDLIYAEDKGLWVATADNRSYSGENNLLYTSENGIEWSVTEVDTLFAFDSIAYHGGQWVGILPLGQIFHSTNLTDWIQVDPNREDVLSDGRYLQGVNFDESQNIWVAYGQGGLILTSLDGVNWEYKFNSHLVSVKAIAFDGSDRYVAVGKGSPSPVSYSDDGVNWQSARGLVDSNQRVESYLIDVVYGDGLWRAVAYDAFYHSTDGVNWTLDIIDYGEKKRSLRNAQVLAYGKQVKRWVAISFDLGEVFILDEEGDNAGKWRFVLEYKESPIYGIAEALLFDGEKWLVATSQSIYYSYDGIAWQEVEYSAGSGRQWFRSIAYGQGKYIALMLGSNARYAVSDDGIQWEVKEFGISGARSITFDNGEWHVVAWDNPNDGDYRYMTYKSVDAVQWNVVPGGSPSTMLVRGRDKWLSATSSGGLLFKPD